MAKEKKSYFLVSTSDGRTASASVWLLHANEKKGKWRVFRTDEDAAAKAHEAAGGFALFMAQADYDDYAASNEKTRKSTLAKRRGGRKWEKSADAWRRKVAVESALGAAEVYRLRLASLYADGAISADAYRFAQYGEIAQGTADAVRAAAERYRLESAMTARWRTRGSR